MNDKKRLKEIRKNLTFLDTPQMDTNLLNQKDYEWFLEQAVRVQELKEEIKSHSPNGRNYKNKQYVYLLKQNQKYREALEQIKDNVPLEYKHNSEHEAKKNAIRLMNISTVIDEALEES